MRYILYCFKNDDLLYEKIQPSWIDAYDKMETHLAKVLKKESNLSQQDLLNLVGRGVIWDIHDKGAKYFGKNIYTWEIR